jgi:four helix bundle protein
VQKIVSYRDLEGWQQSRLLVKNIYQLTKKFPKDEQFGLTNQLRRAAISVPSNIAEGCGRNHFKDSVQFFFISRGSLYEIETQLVLATDLEIISETALNQVMDQVTRCKKLLNGFINYFQQRANNIQPTTINETLQEYGNSNKN